MSDGNTPSPSGQVQLKSEEICKLNSDVEQTFNGKIIKKEQDDDRKINVSIIICY